MKTFVPGPDILFRTAQKICGYLVKDKWCPVSTKIGSRKCS